TKKVGALRSCERPRLRRRYGARNRWRAPSGSFRCIREAIGCGGGGRISRAGVAYCASTGSGAWRQDLGGKRIRVRKQILFSDSNHSSSRKRHQLNAPLKIMVVDDEAALLRLMRATLEAESYQVETAEGGEIALEKLASGKAPDVVLLDMVMPGMDGLE